MVVRKRLDGSSRFRVTQEPEYAKSLPDHLAATEDPTNQVEVSTAPALRSISLPWCHSARITTSPSSNTQRLHSYGTPMPSSTLLLTRLLPFFSCSHHRKCSRCL